MTLTQQIVTALEDHIRTEYDLSVTLPTYPHTHLDLSDRVLFSTYAEGVYTPAGDYLISALSEDILSGKLVLPEGVYHELYSHVEIYFYTD